MTTPAGQTAQDDTDLDGQEAPEKPPGESPGSGKAIIGLIVAAGASLATGVTGLATTGTLGRVQRNSPEEFILALALAAVAAGCFLMAALVARKKAVKRFWLFQIIAFWDWTAKPWRAISVLAAVVGVILGYKAAVDTAGEAERPHVTASLTRQSLTLTATAKASHLASKNPLNVSVDGLAPGMNRPTRLWAASAGPDSDGEVNMPIKVHLPAGRYTAVSVQAQVSSEASNSCAEVFAKAPDLAKTAAREQPGSASVQFDPGAGCVLLYLPPAQRPQLVARWSTKNKRQLRVSARAANGSVGTTADRLLQVEVVGRGARGRRIMLYRSISEPSISGVARRSASVGVPRGVTLVCVRAQLVSARRATKLSRCPARPNTRAATVELRRSDGRAARPAV